ncbi:hypothetical protein H2203_008894 [Taxawa tesnikishii (nom. ined.)]|nr:hypothetical protein H2203_008894 [Dothideales sp. JES 119]
MNTSRSNESNGSTEKMDAPTAANSRTTSSTPTPTPAPKRKLPPFLDHFNARDLKILFRCSVAFWVASLLIFIDPALRAFGSATFFAW